ncbi:hypothetical protein MKZ38_004997 [Zalerion maritima]|uniref:Uncharacterized protein n=1 Tax=Zalerion maritima TaxID=339359 RepID=A0AAD5RLA2_9PEZI|nr:hypothetical protein MKZ38_004997 [Zalerion maritima]
MQVATITPQRGLAFKAHTLGRLRSRYERHDKVPSSNYERLGLPFRRRVASFTSFVGGIVPSRRAEKGGTYRTEGYWERVTTEMEKSCQDLEKNRCSVDMLTVWNIAEGVRKSTETENEIDTSGTTSKTESPKGLKEKAGSLRIRRYLSFKRKERRPPLLPPPTRSSSRGDNFAAPESTSPLRSNPINNPQPLGISSPPPVAFLIHKAGVDSPSTSRCPHRPNIPTKPLCLQTQSKQVPPPLSVAKRQDRSRKCHPRVPGAFPTSLLPPNSEESDMLDSRNRSKMEQRQVSLKLANRERNEALKLDDAILRSGEATGSIERRIRLKNTGAPTRRTQLRAEPEPDIWFGAHQKKTRNMVTTEDMSSPTVDPNIDDAGPSMPPGRTTDKATISPSSPRELSANSENTVIHTHEETEIMGSLDDSAIWDDPAVYEGPGSKHYRYGENSNTPPAGFAAPKEEKLISISPEAPLEPKSRKPGTTASIPFGPQTQDEESTSPETSEDIANLDWGLVDVESRNIPQHREEKVEMPTASEMGYRHGVQDYPQSWTTPEGSLGHIYQSEDEPAESPHALKNEWNEYFVQAEPMPKKNYGRDNDEMSETQSSTHSRKFQDVKNFISPRLESLKHSMKLPENLLGGDSPKSWARRALSRLSPSPQTRHAQEDACRLNGGMPGSFPDNGSGRNGPGGLQKSSGFMLGQMFTPPTPTPLPRPQGCPVARPKPPVSKRELRGVKRRTEQISARAAQMPTIHEPDHENRIDLDQSLFPFRIDTPRYNSKFAGHTPGPDGFLEQDHFRSAMISNAAASAFVSSSSPSPERPGPGHLSSVLQRKGGASDHPDRGREGDVAGVRQRPIPRDPKIPCGRNSSMPSFGVEGNRPQGRMIMSKSEMDARNLVPTSNKLEGDVDVGVTSNPASKLNTLRSQFSNNRGTITDADWTEALRPRRSVSHQEATAIARRNWRAMGPTTNTLHLRMRNVTGADSKAGPVGESNETSGERNNAFPQNDPNPGDEPVDVRFSVHDLRIKNSEHNNQDEEKTLVTTATDLYDEMDTPSISEGEQAINAYVGQRQNQERSKTIIAAIKGLLVSYWRFVSPVFNVYSPFWSRVEGQHTEWRDFVVFVAAMVFVLLVIGLGVWGARGIFLAWNKVCIVAELLALAIGFGAGEERD